MSDGRLTLVVRNLRRLVAGLAGARSSDQELLGRFLHSRDDAAFTALVERHGGLVLGVCRRVLTNEQDAEDACQATFLVLARKAGSIRKQPSLASWLHGVALRTAQKLRADLARRRREQPLADRPARTAAAEASWRELQAVLDEELQRLPATLQAPLTLCYLQGKTRDEAAQELGWTLSTLRGRLERGRQRLRRRLSQRGLSLSGALLATTLSQPPAAAAIPSTLVVTTARAALVVGSGTSAAAAGASVTVTSLAEGVLRAMFMSKLRIASSAVLILTLLAGGAGWLAWPGASEPAAQAAQSGRLPTARARPSQPDDPGQGQGRKAEKVRVIRVASPLDGQITMIGKDPKRSLKEGDKVREGDLLARLDERQARQEVLIKEARIRVAEADRRATMAILAEFDVRVKRAEPLLQNGAMSREEYDALRLSLIRYREESNSKEAAVKVAQAELRQAELHLELHQIRSPVDGVLRAIHYQRGETVKKFDTLLEIQRTD